MGGDGVNESGGELPSNDDGGESREDPPRALVAIVEDEDESAAMLALILQQAQYRTIWYPNGADALAALDHGAEAPDVILLDLVMPRMDGWAFRLEQLARPRLREIPVVVMSAVRSPQMAIDADAFVTKPVRADRLLRVLEEARFAGERRKLAAKGLEVERLRSLGMLVGTVAHELNNPLVYVRGNLELLAQHYERLATMAAETSRALEAARAGTDIIVELVNGLRTFARAEPCEAVADVSVALESAIRIAGQTLRSRATLERRIDAGLPAVVGNQARLSQVFLNLLVNAAQALAPSGACHNFVRISAKREQNEVVVEVEDSGRGIPKELLSQIFEPFFTTKAPGEGTGIGLSFSKEVIERVGGTLSVTSELGKGTIFRVELPVATRASE